MVLAHLNDLSLPYGDSTGAVGQRVRPESGDLETAVNPTGGGRMGCGASPAVQTSNYYNSARSNCHPPAYRSSQSVHGLGADCDWQMVLAPTVHRTVWDPGGLVTSDLGYQVVGETTGLPCQQWTLPAIHCAGGIATSALMVGASIAVFQALGRWRSDSFRQYLEALDCFLAQQVSAMAPQSSNGPLDP